MTKSPKIYLNDTGLLCHLLRVNQGALEGDLHLWGKILETFVAGELLKQVSWNMAFPKLYHYRTTSGQEVDFILEVPNGQIVGIEVKATPSVSAADFKGIKSLAAEEAEKFLCGIVLYTGKEVLSFGEKLLAVPCL